MKLMKSHNKPLLLSVVIGTLLLFIYLHKSDPINQIEERDEGTRSAKKEQIIKSHDERGTCKIPNLPVDAPEMMKFVRQEPPIICDSAEPDWVTVDGSTLTITDEIKSRHGTISCNFTDLIRVDDYQIRDGSVTTIVNTSYPLRESDLVKVRCETILKEVINGTDKPKIWESVLVAIRQDPYVTNKIGWSKIPSPDALKLNVLMFGFDSLSRNTFIRKLPKSYKYLKEELGIQILEGYNIVGDGTPQALIPILTGKSEVELPDTRKRKSGTSYLDVYPMVWKDFKKDGYVTGYFEDMPDAGTFTYRLNGFKEQPTDHLMRPYFMASQKFYSKSPKLQWCFGSLPRHKIFMNHVKNFFKVYKDQPKFLFAFHGELSHDSYNLIGVADDDLLQFLKDLKDSGALKDTIFIMMADHGHRFASIRNTLQGKQEERLPFFGFSFPETFKKEHPEAYQNFVNNKKRLVTPFDINPTLKAVLSLGNTGPANLKNRSLSLFSQIPAERTCVDAGIEPHWCVCLNWIEVPKGSPIVKKLVDTLINTLNSFTEADRKICEIVSLKELLWVSQLSPNSNLLRFKKNADNDGFIPDLSSDMKLDSNIYQIKAELIPGNSLFEASIKHYLKDDKFSLNEKDISRINAYGNQARCLNDQQLELRKYCYCKDGL